MVICLSACGGALPVTDDSPEIVSVDISSGSNGSENSQYVKVSVWFDKAVKADRRIVNELRLTVNGKTPDKKVAVIAAEAMPDDETGLIITLKAAETARSPDKGTYFALYEGNLEISAPTGGLRYLTSADGKKSVRWETVSGVIPSGMTLTEIDSGDGRLTVHVDTVPVVRVVTWVQFCANGSPVMEPGFTKESYVYANDGSIPVHVHYFLRATPESCAEAVIQQLEYFFGETGDYIFSQDGDLIIVERTQPAGNELLSLRVWPE